MRSWIVCLSLSLSACATVKYRNVEVRVPVFACPAAPAELLVKPKGKIQFVGAKETGVTSCLTADGERQLQSVLYDYNTLLESCQAYLRSAAEKPE